MRVHKDTIRLFGARIGLLKLDLYDLQIHLR